MNNKFSKAIAYLIITLLVLIIVSVAAKLLMWMWAAYFREVQG